MKRRQFAILGAAAAALLLSVFVFKRYLPYTGPPTFPRQPPAVVMTIEDAYLVGLGSRGKLWSVKAKKVEVAQNRTTTILSGITRGDVFDSGKVAFSLQAGKAIYDSLSNNLALSGGIKISSEGRIVETEGALWSPRNATLSSTGRVVYRGEWGKLTAERLELDARSRQMSCWRVGWQIDVENAKDAFSLGVRTGAN